MNDSLKHKAAIAALDEVRTGMLVGLGTGSTVRYFIEELGRRVRDGLDVRAIATSVESDRLARRGGIPIVSFADVSGLDVTVDGADEVSPALDLVKGLGGALVREKIVAKASGRLVIVVDEAKLVDRLGTRSPLPVEVIPFATDLVRRSLADIGPRPEVRMKDGAPFVSDNGNHVLDWRCGPIEDPQELEHRLKSMSGVVDSGLFSGMADRVVVAGADGLRTLDR